jgi:hypothetical protein
LRVISVSDPMHPAEVGYCNTPGWASGVAVAGDRAYVADGDSGLRIISVYDPMHPAEVGYCGTPGWANSVTMAEGYAYVADDFSGLRIVSVSDPAHPTEVGHYDVFDINYGVAVVGRCAYVTDAVWLRIISVSDSAHPTEVGYYETQGSVYSVAVVGGYAYVTDEGGGLGIYQFYGAGVEEGDKPWQPTAYSLQPTATVVRGVLEVSQQLTANSLQPKLELLDAAGRRVEELRPGPNDVSRFGAGVYFVRSAKGGERSVVRKVVIQR